MNEFLEQFVIEGRELVERASRDLLELERSPDDRALLDDAFRAFHTLKGAAGIVEFAAMGRAVHAIEESLSEIRAGTRAADARLVTNCLAGLDTVAAWLSEMEKTGSLPLDAERQADQIVATFESARPSAPAPAQVQGSGVPLRARELIEAQQLLVAQRGEGEAGRLGSALRVAVNVLVHLGRNDEASRIAHMLTQTLTADAVGASLQQVLGLLADAPAQGTDAVRADREEGAARTLRVDIGRIDALVKLTGELTAAKNAIGEVADMARRGDDARALAELLRDRHASLDRLVNELQRAVLSVRLLPLGQVFARFPRLVREMSNEFGKQVRLSTEGEDTEADKAIVEALFEPLLHVVRNAMDHGVEEPHVRSERGKPGAARLVLRARRSGENVIVEVEDDGRGVDVARVRALAGERGVAAVDALAAMTDAEAAELIFTPGFSTAGRVSSVSGRGVGMDAVKSSIESMGGRVEIENRPGQGLLVRFRLPFTLIMTRVLIVTARGQAFGIPFDAVVETVRMPRAAVSAIGAARACVYRDRTTPVIDLAHALGGEEGGRQGDALLVVTDIDGELAAFEVDTVGTSADVMLEPLDGLLAGVGGVAGATVLGDGKVLIVLDLSGLAL